MKYRSGFVSNSSSSSFIITNKTEKELDLSEFVLENSYLLERFVAEYCVPSDRFSLAIMMQEAYGGKLKPGKNIVVFGDEDGTQIGHVYDYILRDGGTSRRFEWSLYEFLR